MSKKTERSGKTGGCPIPRGSYKSSPVISPATGLKGSLKGEGDEPQLTKLSQSPTAHLLGDSQVIHSVWLPMAINWLLNRCNNERLQLSEESHSAEQEPAFPWDRSARTLVTVAEEHIR